jgi:hypothetical protein
MAKTNPIRVLFVLGIMEIETWFYLRHATSRVNSR